MFRHLFHLFQPPRKPFPSFRRAAYVRKTWNCRTWKWCRLYISSSCWVWVLDWIIAMASSLATKLCLLLRYAWFFFTLHLLQAESSAERLNTCSVHRCILSGLVLAILAYKAWESWCSGQGPAWRESIRGRKPQQLGLLGRFEHEIGSREVWNDNDDKLQKIQGDDRPVLTSIVFLFPF